MPMLALNRTFYHMKILVFLVFIIVFGTHLPVLASDGITHSDPAATVVLYLGIMLIAAKIAGDLAVRMGQPSVLGELIIGVVLGNLTLFGFRDFEPIKLDPFVDMLARIGVLILLFEVGLESTVGQMLKVGRSAVLVAILGVLAPFVLGWGVGVLLLPNATIYAHAFLGATLCATSVGITARVLQDLGRSQSAEARVILGAAVIDDVLGLVVLAVVVGIITSANQGMPFSYWSISVILGMATLFLFGSLALGIYCSPRLFQLASKLQSRGVLLALGLSFCFLLSWLSSAMGLASIVGAFAAGLILEDVHYRHFIDQGERSLEELIKPVAAFLVPIFFVLMGMRTDLASFGGPGVLVLALALTIAAILGKQLCSLGVLGKRVDRVAVGLGMIPRGEVGLIFADIGFGLSIQGTRVIDEAVFSAIVIMVIITTMVTPPALKWRFNRCLKS